MKSKTESKSNSKSKSRSTKREIVEELDAYLNACIRAFQFSGAIIVAHDGKPIYSQACGFANLEHRVPNTTSTKFRLGSVTKQFTAMAIMILQERRKLKVSESISKYIENAPPHWDNVSVHHLLTHTSGMPEYTRCPDYVGRAKSKTTAADLMAIFRDGDLEFVPGTKFAYTNAGYVLLGVIIEALSGMPYGEFLQKNIFQPLGMKDSGVDENERILPHRASGYVGTEDGLENATYRHMSWPYAAGALYSTAKDLLLWERALLNETLISRASTEAMFTPELDGFAYGWVVGEFAGRKTIGHAGGTVGFSANIDRIPADRYCSIVLCNVDQVAPVCQMADELRAIVFSEPYELPRKHKAISVKPSVYDAYVGRYLLQPDPLHPVGPDWIVTISVEGNRLMFEGLGDQSLLPMSETEFFVVGIYEQRLTFCKDETGVVTHFTLHIGRAQLQGKKLGQ